MNTVMAFSTFYLTTMIGASMNPVKVSFLVVTLSLTVFAYAAVTTASAWFPLMLFMLFMGGVLIVFLILSSLTPNENVSKKGSPLMLITGLFLMFFFYSTLFCSIQEGNAPLGLGKGYLTSSWNMIFLSMIVLTYFLTFVSTLSTEKTSLQLKECRFNFNFVSW